MLALWREVMRKVSRGAKISKKSQRINPKSERPKRENEVNPRQLYLRSDINKNI